MATDYRKKNVYEVRINSYLGEHDFTYDLRPAMGCSKFEWFEWCNTFIQELQILGGKLACDFVIMSEELFFELTSTNKMHITDSFSNIAHKLAEKPAVCVGKLGKMDLFVSKIIEKNIIYMDRRGDPGAEYEYRSYLNIVPDTLMKDLNKKEGE